jgi:arsenate reductase (glutaredoxin)
MIDSGTRCAQRELEARLRPFIARRVPRADVDDVLQDVFLRAQRALPDLRDEERFGAWMYRVARSAIAESHRQRSRHPVLDVEEPALRVATEASDPTPLETEVAEYLIPLISRLPAPYREAITLTELQGLTQQAAADALGISLSGAKSRVQRGREKLRALLDECCKIGVDARGRVIDCEPRLPSGCRCKSEWASGVPVHGVEESHMNIVIYHNPDCGTSRNTLSIIRAAGYEPTVIPYLEVGWTRAQLLGLFAAADLTPRAALRESKSPAKELGLLDPSVDDEALLSAMVQHPVLVNRPIVCSAKGVKLCRPSELVLDLLERLPPGPLAKEDGELIIDADGRRVA